MIMEAFEENFTNLIGCRNQFIAFLPVLNFCIVQAYDLIENCIVTILAENLRVDILFPLLFDRKKMI